jgi:hypothetical protein
VHVHLGLEVVPVPVLLGIVVAGGRTHEPPPERRREQRGPLRDRRQQVPVAGGLAAEGDRPARPQHTGELGEGLAEVRDVMQDGMAEDEVEALIREGQGLGLRGRGLHV